MRKFILTLVTSVLGFATVSAFIPEALESSLDIGVGYRWDQLKTKSSFEPGGFEPLVPNATKTELKWDNLGIWQINIFGKYVTCDNIYLRGKADFGWVVNGKNHIKTKVGEALFSSDQTSFSTADNADFVTIAQFDDHHKMHKGHVYDASLAIGYQFRLCDDSFAIAPVVGYGWNGQHLKLGRSNSSSGSSSTFVTSTSTDFTTATSSSSSSSSSNHNKFNTRWNGPFVGLDFDYRFYCDWSVFAAYEFHWAEYHAHGELLNFDVVEASSSDFGLFNGFTQHARRAYGNLFDIGLKWDFCDNWTVSLLGEFQWWCANKGHEKRETFFLKSGNVELTSFVKTPMHGVRWNSSSVTLNLGMVF